ncbi:MAG: cytochrome c biogenesis CcdA family protein [Dehalococcoidia bacterium]
MDSFLQTLADVVDKDPWLALPVAFLAGLISSASPCVLAMIPLVIGFVGGYAGGSQRKAVQYSLVFMVGLTITFTILGVIAGAMGRLFGDIGDFWKWVVPIVAIVLGIWLFWGFQWKVGISERFLPKRRALLGAFLIGLVFGVVSSPCATPVLGVILTIGAVQDNLAWSGLLLFFYALGHWVLVLGAGISVGFAQKVVESKGIAGFSTWAKRAGGVVLVGTGGYLLIYPP